jgi:iron complex outermembrane receptor protein
LNTWEHAGSAKRIWTTKAAWINDFLCFNLAGDTDTSRSRQALISSEMATSFGKPWAFRAGASALRQWAQVDGYSDSTKWFGQTRLAGFAMSEWQHRETRISALLRQEWAEAQAAPFTASLSGQQGLRRVGDLRFHLSRNFNLPTLNDRFWKNLGKTDLRPEKGFSADLGWSYTRPAYSIELTGFQLVLDDWILWQPDSSGLFRPGNLRKVWSRGLEANGKWQVVRDDWKLNFSGRIQASKTTNVSVYAGSKAALGKQLAYTPNVSGGATIRVSRGIFSLAFLQQFTGARLDNGANKLKPFQLSNLLGTCNFLKGHLITEFRIENLWNAQYEVIRYRPMPGRTWNLGIGYKW